MSRTQVIKGYPFLYVEEFRVSATYPHLAERIVFNRGDLQKIWFIGRYQFRFIRDWTFRVFPGKGKPVWITSGKCSLELNLKLRLGNPMSEHLWYSEEAAWDFTIDCDDELNEACFRFIKNDGYLLSHTGQLILETGHIHWSIPSDRHQKPDVFSLI